MENLSRLVILSSILFIYMYSISNYNLFSEITTFIICVHHKISFSSFWNKTEIFSNKFVILKTGLLFCLKFHYLQNHIYEYMISTSPRNITAPIDYFSWKFASGKHIFKNKIARCFQNCLWVYHKLNVKNTTTFYQIWADLISHSKYSWKYNNDTETLLLKKILFSPICS